jgi:hypothetical protein
VTITRESPNKIRWRNMSFRVGLLILLILWIAFALHIAGVA